MVQLDDTAYTKLKKDADDNNQLLRLIRMGLIFLAFVIVFVTWGTKYLDVQIQAREAQIRSEAIVIEAQANKRAREIESAGLTNEEYFKWLEVRNKG